MTALTISVPPPAPPAIRDFTEVRVPAIMERESIKAGTGLPVLDHGVGRMRHTGNLISLWGHRVTPVNGRPHGPFYRIDQLKAGDEIVLSTSSGRTQTFTIFKKRLIRSNNWMPFRPRVRRVLTLSACAWWQDGPGHARGEGGGADARWVVFAR